jgi:hypothetical protein
MPQTPIQEISTFPRKTMWKMWTNPATNRDRRRIQQIDHSCSHPLWQLISADISTKNFLDCTILEADNYRPSAIAPQPDAREEPMTRYMVWVQIENNEGWGCTLCDWLIAASDIDTTVAALKYNHEAQQAFDAHECCVDGNGSSPKSR